MIGIRGTRTISFALKHQTIGTKNVKETVTTYNKLFTKVLTTELIQLTATRMRKMFTDMVAVMYHTADKDINLFIATAMLVISLTG